MHVLTEKKLSQIYDHSFQLKSVENRALMTPNVSRRKEIIKTRVKVNKLGNNFKTEKIWNQKIVLCKNFKNKRNKFLARVVRRKDRRNKVLVSEMR